MKVKATIRKNTDKEEPPKRNPDPIKSYRDSLSLYQRSQAALNPKYYSGSPIWYNFKEKGDTKKVAEFVKKHGILNRKEYEALLKGKKAIEGVDYKVWAEGKVSSEPLYLPLHKKPVEPVIFKAREKEKIERIEPTAKKISEKKETPKIKMTPTAVKPSELIYRVEYFDPESGKQTAKFFANEKQGSEFQKSLSSEQNKYGSRGMYIKNENK